MGRWKTAELLLAIGADVQTKNDGGYALMRHACQEGYLEIVKLLVQYGANVHYDRGFLPLESAWYNNHFEIVKFLIENGASLEDRRFSPLHWACKEGRLDIIPFLIQNGAGPNDENHHGKTAFHTACDHMYCSNLKAAKLLLKNGADLNLKSSRNGMTQLQTACSKRGCLKMIKFLVDNGANLEVKDRYGGKTALHVACEYRQWDAAKSLLEYGADLNATDNAEKTPLHAACKTKCGCCPLEVAKIFIENGANPNAQDRDGNTPLHFACEAAYVDLVKLLVSQGANLDTKTAQGSTPLHVACSNKYHNQREVVWFLVRQYPWLVSVF